MEVQEGKNSRNKRLRQDRSGYAHKEERVIEFDQTEAYIKGK